MLISSRAGELRIVTQVEHARVAGVMAAAWGNERFPASVEPGSLTIAATRHDDGWRELDAAPVTNDEAGRPAHFLEVPLTVTAGPYGEGVDAIYDEDVRAGVLASLHRSGLWAARWGMHDSGPLEHPLAREIVAFEDARASERGRELWEARGGLRSAFLAGLWRDYETLQALDILSLAVCLLDTTVPSDPAVAAPRMSGTLRPLVQPPGGRIVECVPATPGGHAELRLDVVEPGVVTVAPFPFASGRVEIEFDARRLADGPHEDPVAAYHGAEAVTTSVVLVPAAI